MDRNSGPVSTLQRKWQNCRIYFLQRTVKLRSDFLAEFFFRKIASQGGIRKEYIEQREAQRKRFLAEKEEEEKKNLEMIESLDDSLLKSEIEQQAQALREIEEIKKRKEMEEADAEFARKLMQEEEEKSNCRIISGKAAWEKTVDRHRRISQEWKDHELAVKLSTPPR